MSQKESILRHLKRYGRISPIDALKMYGCFRLAARVAELRRDGWPIETDTSQGHAIYFMNEHVHRRARA